MLEQLIMKGCIGMSCGPIAIQDLAVWLAIILGTSAGALIGFRWLFRRNTAKPVTMK